MIILSGREMVLGALCAHWRTKEEKIVEEKYSVSIRKCLSF